MKNNKLIIFVLILIAGLMIHTSKITIQNDKKDFKNAEDAGFESEEVYQCVLEKLNKEEDDEITDAELEGITSLSCPDAGIDNAADIAKLTGLKELNLSNNIINEIDLSDNTELEYLDLSSNSIKTIDLSKNNKIIGISITDNDLNKIDFSETSETIKTVVLNRNYLENIDVSGLTNLEVLYVESNILEELDLSKNTKLKVLNASNNVLSEVDLSNNTELVSLRLGDNYISEIDLTKLVKLKELNIFMNSIGEIDLSKNNLLETLIISYNELEELDLSGLTNLTSINVAENQLEEVEIDNKDKIVHLGISYDLLNDFDFSDYTNLEVLNVYKYDTLNVASKQYEAVELKKHIPEGITVGDYKIYAHYQDTIVCDYDESEMVTISISELKNSADSFVGLNEDSAIDCDAITDKTLSVDDYAYLQLHSSEVSFKNVEIPDSVETSFSSLYDINYLEEDPNPGDDTTVDEEGNQVITNVPNTGVTIINIILFGITVLITGFYIISRAMQTKKTGND